MLPSGHEEVLAVASLVTGYGARPVLHGVNLSVGRGEILALIGHNGAGKSTVLKAIFGLLPVWEGEIRLDGNRVGTAAPRLMLKRGVSYVPQGNRVFGDLTVIENIRVGGVVMGDEARVDDGIGRALALFPALRPHLRQRAVTLSGGEKQMLALANAVIRSPRALLLDEPSLGLAPGLVSKALSLIAQISLESGTTVLIVEQKVREVLKIATRVCVLRNGEVSFLGTAEELRDERRLREVYL